MSIRRGFTLIELLVVVSIFSMLSSIVLASLSRAVDKAKLTAVLHDMYEIRTLSVAYYGDHNNYGPGQSDPATDSCDITSNTIFSDPGVKIAIADIQKRFFGGYITLECRAVAGTGIAPYTFSVELHNSDNQENYCVDKDGVVSGYSQVWYNFAHTDGNTYCVAY